MPSSKIRALPVASRPSSLASLGEDNLLSRLTSRWTHGPRTLVGVGDDCAVLRGEGTTHRLLFKTDAVVEGAHFLPSASPRLIGRKALGRAVSDIAAMGGRPLAALITLGLPRETPLRRLDGMYRGLEGAAKEFGVDLVGGETTQAAQLFLSIALLGETRGHLPVLRSTAHEKDLLFVTGVLGGTRPRHQFHFTPRLREGEWLARQRLASAMMDISDGLGADLPRLARASGCGFHLDPERVPRRRGASLAAALGDGEDFELLFAVRPRHAERLKKEWPFTTRLSSIGSLAAASNSAEPLPGWKPGYDHFKQR